jgi:hypothetical protein
MLRLVSPAHRAPTSWALDNLPVCICFAAMLWWHRSPDRGLPHCGTGLLIGLLLLLPSGCCGMASSPCRANVCFARQILEAHSALEAPSSECRITNAECRMPPLFRLPLAISYLPNALRNALSTLPAAQNLNHNSLLRGLYGNPRFGRLKSHSNANTCSRLDGRGQFLLR